MSNKENSVSSERWELSEDLKASIKEDCNKLQQEVFKTCSADSIPITRDAALTFDDNIPKLSTAEQQAFTKNGFIETTTKNILNGVNLTENISIKPITKGRTAGGSVAF